MVMRSICILLFVIVFVILMTGCQPRLTPSIEMDVDLGSFGTKHITLPVTLETIDNHTGKLSFNMEEHFSFHAGYKVTVVATEHFIGKITYDEAGNPLFAASKEIEYVIHTVDSVNVKTSTSTKTFVNVGGDWNVGKFKLTHVKQP